MGSGSWGTALSILLCENGQDVRLWSYSAEECEVLQKDREHKAFLPGVKIPQAIADYEPGGRGAARRRSGCSGHTFSLYAIHDGEHSRILAAFDAAHQCGQRAGIGYVKDTGRGDF